MSIVVLLSLPLKHFHKYFERFFGCRSLRGNFFSGIFDVLDHSESVLNLTYLLQNQPERKGAKNPHLRFYTFNIWDGLSPRGKFFLITLCFRILNQ